MRRKIAMITSAISLVVLSSTLFGATYASWAVTDAAPTKTMKISTSGTVRTVTFYKTYGGSAWGGSEDVVVLDGESLSSGDIPNVLLSGYTFKGWVLGSAPDSTHYTATYSNTDIVSLSISENKVFYPILESDSSFAYANSAYYSIDTDYDLDVSSVSSVKVGKRYVGVTGIPNATATKSTQNLITSSGKYQFKDTGDIFRKVGFYPNTSWRSLWNSTYPSFSFHTWGTYGEYDYLRPSDIENYRYVAYIPATNDNFGIVRQAPDASSVDYGNNHSGDLKFSDTYAGSTSYSKTNWILGQYNDVGWNNGWTKSSSWWGDENIS